MDGSALPFAHLGFRSYWPEPALDGREALPGDALVTRAHTKVEVEAVALLSACPTT